jgi:transmembrane sensor
VKTPLKKVPGAPGRDLPDDMLEQATRWQGRLREPADNAAHGAARQAEFRAWLDTDARHPDAFDEAGRLWDLLERPAARAFHAERAAIEARYPAAASRPRKVAVSRNLSGNGRRWTAGFSPGRAMAFAACLLIAIGAGTVWRDDIVTGLQSDYATAVGERAPVTLTDGSRLTLNTDSAIAVALGPTGRRVRLLRGEVWFDVAHDAARPFVVETPQGRVRVTGTRFDVRLGDDETVVSLAEGRVELTASGALRKDAVALAPGEQSRLSASGISSPAKFDPVATTAWLNGKFVFYDAPLAEVVTTLNRYRHGRIVIYDGALNRLKVSGVFATDDPNAALSVIANTLPVRVTRLTDFLVFLH